MDGIMKLTDGAKSCPIRRKEEPKNGKDQT